MEDNQNNPTVQPDQSPQPPSTPVAQPAPATTPESQVTTTSETPPPTQKTSFLKLLLYFLVGFILSPLGLIFGLLWIWLRVKENKKPRLIALITGTILGLVIGAIIGYAITRPLYNQIDSLTVCLEQTMVAMDKITQSGENLTLEERCIGSEVFTQNLKECYVNTEQTAGVPYIQMESTAKLNNPDLFTLNDAIELHNTQCGSFPDLLITPP